MARDVVLRRLVALSLVAAILALVPAAQASPPDQTWIPGLYDNADFDDVILFITSGLGAVQPSLVWSPRMVALVVGLVLPADTPVQSLRRVASGPSALLRSPNIPAPVRRPIPAVGMLPR